MDDRSRVLAIVLVGAAMGGVAGYLLLTENGRRLRSQIEPTFEEIVRELNRLSVTVNKARTVATEGWRLLTEIAGEAEPPSRWGSPIRQQAPF